MPITQNLQQTMSYVKSFFYTSILLYSPQQIFSILQIGTPICSFKSDSRELFLNLTFSPFIYNSLSNPFDSTHTYSQISLYSCHPSPIIIYHLILLFPICSSHRNQKNSLRTQTNLIITSPCLIASQVTNPQLSLPAYAESDPPALSSPSLYHISRCFLSFCCNLSCRFLLLQHLDTGSS